MSAEQIIKGFEGCSLVAYHGAADPSNVWTIGYGTTFYPDGTRVQENDTCTIEQAEAWLQEHVDQFASIVDHQVQVTINDNQRAALTSFVYNVGSNAFQRSTLLDMLNNGDYEGASHQFPRWSMANGKQVQGLLNRRLKEQELFNTPVPVMVAKDIVKPVAKDKKNGRDANNS